MFFTPSVLSMGLALLATQASAAIHDITVGSAAGDLTFTPEAISANPGDQVVFTFEQKNHTATQSSFANPCGQADGGFNSGFMPVGANVTSDFPTFTINVTDTKPIWVFCDQAANTAASHCGKGMVFAVNCGQDGSANSFTNFKAAALAQGAALAAAASSSSAGGYGYGSPTSAATAAYGGVTIPPAPTPVQVTATVSVETSTWTTTYASYPGSPDPTPASLAGNVIKVIVGGNNTLTYDPPHVAAQPRDTIVFEFQTKNHTITESSFADPCRALVNASTGATGFDSGFMPVPAGTSEGGFPTFNYTVVDTAPVWAYCRQKTPASHCGLGMVFAINSVESSARNFSAFQALAEQLNGTSAAAASGAPSPTPSGSASGAGALSARSAGLTGLLGVVALVFVAAL